MRGVASALVLVVCALSLAAGCGAGSGEVAAPAPPPAEPIVTEPAPSAAPAETPARPSAAPDMEPHIRDALAELERAEGALNEAVAPEAEKKRDGAAPQGAGANTEADPCKVACLALASMRRSAAYLCKLAGEGDPRCPAARARVENAEARVRARCRVCAG